MNSKTKSLINIATLILLNVIYLVLFSCRSRQLLGTGISDFGFNAIFFIVYFWVLYVIIGKNLTVFSSEYYLSKEPFFKKFGVIRILLLLAVQLLADILEIVASFFESGFIMSVGVALDLLIFWVLVYVILTFKTPKSFNLKYFVVLALAVVLLTVLLVVFHTKCIEIYDAAIQEYLNSIEDPYGLFGFVGALELPPKAVAADRILAAGRICYDVLICVCFVLYRKFEQCLVMKDFED